MSETVADRFLTIEEVAHLTGCGKSTLYRMALLGTFPQQIRLTRAVRWSEREVLEWMEAQKQKRPAVQAGPLALIVVLHYSEVT